MEFRVAIAVEADAELNRIAPFYRRTIAHTIARLLTTEPRRESKARIKLLRQPAASVYRLRVGDYRVFYDVTGNQVVVLHVRHKSECADLYGGQSHEN